MIYDSIPWRQELGRIARRLERKSRQAHWNERSSFLVERSFMDAGFAIRRLLEARKLADSLAASRIKVTRYPRKGSIPDFYTRDDIDEHYDLDGGVKDQITLTHLANQLIHSYVWVLSFDGESEEDEGDGEGHFIGVFLASEKERQKHVYFLPAGSLIAICRTIAVEDVVGVEMRRDEAGLLQVTRVISSTDPESEYEKLSRRTTR
ncbi:hypothetical protein ABIB17_000464 [Arthrobacter sp. UYEF6]